MLRDLDIGAIIGANAVYNDKKEQGADAECEDGVGVCPSEFNGAECEDGVGVCPSEFNGSPPLCEERSAAAACTSRAAAGTVTAALM